ncbi:MAG: hypothetical protein AAB362_00300 [Patescibacteria group bacterium]
MKFYIFLKNKTVLVVFLLLGTINAGTAFFIVKPLYEKIIAFENEISEAQKKIAYFDRRREYFLGIGRSIHKEDATLKRVEKTILDINSPLPFIELIEELGREQGVQAKILVHDAPKDGLQKFQIIAEGDFPRLFHYLRVLELLPYQITFVSAHVSSSGMADVFAGESVPGVSSSGRLTRTTISKMAIDIIVRIKK